MKFYYLNSKEVERFIVYEENNPFAFNQSYKINNEPFWMGIDQLIGEEHFLHQGYGQHVIRLFIDLIRIDRRIDKVIVDPQINNQKAIACYEKLGFRKVKKVESEIGELFIMELELSEKC